MPPRDGPSCRKRRYRDRIAALLALATVQARGKTSRPKQEHRAYRCPRCGGFHLTSQPRRKPHAAA